MTYQASEYPVALLYQLLCYPICTFVPMCLRNPQHRPPLNVKPLQSRSNLVNFLKFERFIMRAHPALRRHLQQRLHLVFCSHRAAYNVVSTIDAVDWRNGDMVVRAGETNTDQGSDGTEKLDALLVGFFETDDHNDGVGADVVG